MLLPVQDQGTRRHLSSLDSATPTFQKDIPSLAPEKETHTLVKTTLAGKPRNLIMKTKFVCGRKFAFNLHCSASDSNDDWDFYNNLIVGTLLTSINWTSMSSMSGLRSMLGALVKLSWMYWKVPAARRNASTALSSPRLVLRSCRVPICVYTAPMLNSTHAFSNATVRWQLGTPVNESYLKEWF